MSGLLLFYLSLAIGVSFLCSLLEATLLSVSHGYVALLVKEGKRSGPVLERLKARVDRPIIAILTLNTVANTAGAAGVGAEVHRQFGSQWVALGSALLTFGILVVSEVIPKTLGAAHWMRIAPFAAYALRVMVWALAPVVWVLEWLSRTLSSDDAMKRVSREEIMVFAEIGRDEGVLRRRESRIINNLLLLQEVLVKDIMTPRRVMHAVARDQTVSDVMGEAAPLPFSRLPVFGSNVDDIVGIVFRHKVLEAVARDAHDTQLVTLMQPIRAIPESATVAHALEEFIRRREHMLLVVDEYGGTEGIVTLEDAIETLLGVEIVDESDAVTSMRKLALDLWEKRKDRYTGFRSVPNADDRAG